MYSLRFLRNACFGLSLLLSLLFAPLLSASANAQVYSSSAFGVSAQFTYPSVNFGPTPEASGSTDDEDPYSDTDSYSSSSVLIPSSGPNQGKILNLSTKTLEVNAEGDSSNPSAYADSTLNNLNISLLSGLLTLKAKSIKSSALIKGDCDDDFDTELNTTIEDFKISGFLGKLFKSLLVGSPAPNTSVSAFGITVILNEQIEEQDAGGISIEVNALRIVVDNVLLKALGIIGGEIIVGHSEAKVDCPISD